MTLPSGRERGLSQKNQDEGWRDVVGWPRKSELAVQLQWYLACTLSGQRLTVAVRHLQLSKTLTGRNEDRLMLKRDRFMQVQ